MVISRETAPNDWAMVCAEMGYVFVSALPLLKGDDRIGFARNAVTVLENARLYLAAGGFMQDLQKLDAALETARQVADAGAPAAPGRN